MILEIPKPKEDANSNKITLELSPWLMAALEQVAKKNYSSKEDMAVKFLEWGIQEKV
jgi:hypothetical protein